MHAGAAALENQRIAVAHQFGDARADGPLAGKARGHAPFERRLVEALGQHDAAVNLQQQTLLDQRLDIAADGFVETPANRAASAVIVQVRCLLADEPQDFGLALESRAWSRADEGCGEFSKTTG